MKDKLLFAKAVTMLAFVSIISCNKSEIQMNDTCEVLNPMEKLLWLSEAKNEVKNDKFSYCSMGMLEGETVFFFDNCNPYINYVSILNNCHGERIGLKNDHIDDLTETIILWKHKDSLCDM